MTIVAGRDLILKSDRLKTIMNKKRVFGYA